DFSADRGTSPRELVWLIQSGQATVALPDGRLEGQSPISTNETRDGVTNRMTINRDHVIVESAGKRLFAGAHQLSPDQPRYVGLRILRKTNANPANVKFQSLKILLPQPTASPQ